MMKNKKGIVLGAANNRSIAWSVAEELHKQGANIGLTYQTEKLKSRVQKLSDKVSADFLIECDVTCEKSLDVLFSTVRKEWGSLDFIVHSLAFSHREELEGYFYHTSRDNFLLSMEISCFSLINIMNKAESLLNDNASVVTFTYDGSQKAIPNYNVMGVCKAALESSVRYLARDFGDRGIRVNAVSPGPVKTLAAAGIKGGKNMLEWSRKNSFLQKDCTLSSIASTACFLLSDSSDSITAEVIYVDCGYHAFGMPQEK